MGSSPRLSSSALVDVVLLKGKSNSAPSIGYDLTDSGTQCPTWLFFKLPGHEIIGSSHGGPKEAFWS